jgi:hypothetical protein
MCSDSDSRTLRLVAHTLYSNQVFVDSEGVFRVHDWAMSGEIIRKPLLSQGSTEAGIAREAGRLELADGWTI